MEQENYLTGCQLRQYIHISTRKLKALMDNNVIPHIDTGLKTHKYLIRVEDAEYYAKHRDLQKDYELTPKQVPGRHKPSLRIEPDRFYAYLQHKWRNKPDALTSREITEMIGVSNQHIGRLIQKNVLYGVKIHDRRYSSKDSVLKYASSEQAIRSLYNETYTALIKQCIREWK